MIDPEKFFAASESYHDGNSAGCANCSENVPHCCACVPSFHVQNSLPALLVSHCLWTLLQNSLHLWGSIVSLRQAAFAKLHRQGSHKPAMTSCTKACSEWCWFSLALLLIMLVLLNAEAQENHKKIWPKYFNCHLQLSTLNCQKLPTANKNCQPSTKSCHCWYFLAGYLELSVEIILMTCFLLWMAAPRKRRIHSISRRRSPKRELLRRTCQQRREQKGMMLMTELSGTICSPAGNLPTGTAWVLLLWPWLFFENRATAGWNQKVEGEFFWDDRCGCR